MHIHQMDDDCACLYISIHALYTYSLYCIRGYVIHVSIIEATVYACQACVCACTCPHLQSMYCISVAVLSQINNNV